MPELKFEAKTLNVVSYLDLNDLVKELTGLPWNMQQQGEMMSNGSYKIIKVDGDSELDFYGPDYQTYRGMIDEWLASPIPQGWQEEMHFERDNGLEVELILHELWCRKIIPTGEYLILVGW